MPLGRRGRRALSLYIRAEATLSVLAAAVTIGSIIFSFIRFDNPAAREVFQTIGVASGVLTFLLFTARMSGSASRVLVNAEGQINLLVLSESPDQRVISLMEKIESGAELLAEGSLPFRFEIARGPDDLDYLVRWSEADRSIAESQAESLDRKALYRAWYDVRPDIFMLARNRDGVPFCGSIILPMKQRGAELLERDGTCAVTLRRPEIAGSSFRHLLIDTWVGDSKLQSHRARRHPPFDDLTKAGYALRVAHLAYFFRLGKIEYIWFEPSNPYLMMVAERLAFAERKGHTGKPKTFSYVISIHAARALARAAGERKRGTVAERIDALATKLQALSP